MLRILIHSYRFVYAAWNFGISSTLFCTVAITVDRYHSIFFLIMYPNSKCTEVTDLSIVIVIVENKDELIPNVNVPECILNDEISKKLKYFFTILITPNRIIKR